MINSRPIQDYMAWIGSTTLFSASRSTAMSVPAGFSSTGLPIGLQIIGPVGGDAAVLHVARCFEAATGHGLRHPELSRWADQYEEYQWSVLNEARAMKRSAAAKPATEDGGEPGGRWPRRPMCSRS